MLQKFTPDNKSNRMAHVGDLQNARKSFVQKENLNLNWLLKSRFTWMNKFIHSQDVGLELGSGIAASKYFIKCKKMYTTDFIDSEWLDIKNIDALSTGFSDNSFDFIIVSNTIHHLAFPHIFLHETLRILKPNGKLIIQDIYTSFCMRLILKLMRHEGFNEKIDVFNKTIQCNIPEDPWSANCSIPKLLFSNNEVFEKTFLEYRIIHYKRVEFLKFLNSGGVIAKTKFLPLGEKLLKSVDKIDRLLIEIAAPIFALQVQIVLEKHNIVN
jgi:SAM-dependent methyltransferase